MPIQIHRPKHLEYKIRKTVYNSLRHQFSYLKKNWGQLYDKPNSWIGVWLKELKNKWLQFYDYEKWFGWAELDVFRDTMGTYGMVSLMYQDVERTVMNWYRARYMTVKKEMAKLWIDFDVKNPAVTKYMTDWRDLQLSDYKGSISRTTKAWVIKIFQDSYEKGLSTTEIQKNINALDSTLFSMTRAKIIAVNETAMAFETGNAIPMQEAVNQWGNVEKSRSTVWDNKVEEECQMNEDEWRIPFNDPHSSWDDVPPAHINCRCTELYQIN